MKIYKKSMLIEESDNVAVAVEPIQAGECTLVAGEEITANEYIKEGHKIARTDIEKGAEIIKYGVHIGVATQFIKKGDWVHEHNVYDDFEEINREQRAYYRSMHRMPWITRSTINTKRKSWACRRRSWAISGQTVPLGSGTRWW